MQRNTLRSAGGFTLIELMVVVVIATILVTIAIPMYTSQVQQSRRTDARTALLDLASREERFLTTNPTGYTTSPVSLGYPAFSGHGGSGLLHRDRRLYRPLRGRAGLRWQCESADRSVLLSHRYACRNTAEGYGLRNLRRRLDGCPICLHQRWRGQYHSVLVTIIHIIKDLGSFSFLVLWNTGSDGSATESVRDSLALFLEPALYSACRRLSGLQF